MDPALTTQRTPLTQERVVAGAVDYADQHGLGALSMRKLATSLGFEVMSLYNHVKNKPDLIRRMTDLVANEIPVPSQPDDPLAALRQHAIEMRHALERHSWAAMSWITTLPGPARWDLMEWQLRTVAAINGLTDEQAHHGYHAITNHVVGYVLQNEVMPFDDDDLEDVVQMIKPDLDEQAHAHVLNHIGQHQRGEHGESFDYVLDLILGGLTEL